jgi:hypothetical protein
MLSRPRTPRPKETQVDDGTSTLGGPPWFAANEFLAFVLELAAVAILAWWGFASGGTLAVRIVLGVGAPAVAVALWGLFAAPRARFRPPLAGVLVVKALVLLGAAAALYALGHPVGATVMAVVVVANTAVAEANRERLGRRSL